MTLFSGLGTDVHFSGDETGLQWEDYLFEVQNAVEWRMTMSTSPAGQLSSTGGATHTGEASLPGMEETMGAHDLQILRTSIRHVVVGGTQGVALCCWS